MGFNTWETFGCDISEALIHASAEAMVSTGLLAAGYTYLNLDDCWMAKERNATGHLQPSANFSSGMGALGEFVHSKGLRYGLYQSAGTKTCQQYAGSLGNEWIDAQTFAEWEIDFLKYDDCFHELFTDPKRFPFDAPPILRYPLMGQALNKTGRHISYMCNFPWQLWGLRKDAAMGGEWVGEFCNSWRTCGDPGPGFGSAVSYCDCAEQWASAIPSGPGRWNNLDALEIGSAGSTMTEPQEQAVFSLYALIKTPLFVGGDVAKLPAHSLRTYLNTEVIALNQDALGVPGRQLRAAESAGLGELWGGPLSGGEAAAILLNRGDSPRNSTVRWVDLYGNQSTPVRATARDLWQHKDLGEFNAGLTVEVPATSAVTLRIKPV